MLVILCFILIAIFVGYYYLITDKANPSFTEIIVNDQLYTSPIEVSQNSKVAIKIKSEDKSKPFDVFKRSGILSLNISKTAETQTSTNLLITRVGDEFHTLDIINEEGTYKYSLFLSDKSGNIEDFVILVHCIDSPPVITMVESSIEEDDYIFQLSMVGEDDLSLSEGYVVITLPNGSSVNVTLKPREGRFVGSFLADFEGEYSFTYFLVDTKGQTSSGSSQKSTIIFSLGHRFIRVFAEKGFNESVLQAICEAFPEIVEELYGDEGLEEYVTLANSSGILPIEENAAGILVRSLYSNMEVNDNPMLIVHASRVINHFKFSSLSEPQLWFLVNLTQYQDEYIVPVYGEELLDFGLRVISGDVELIRGFNPRMHHVLCYLLKFNPEIDEHVLGLKAGVQQVDSIVYGREMDKPKSEEYVWIHFVQPRMAYVVQKENEGKINCLDYGDLEANLGIVDPELEMKTARAVLLPIELTEVYIKTGERWIGPSPDKGLEIGEANVNFDEELGKSPQEWLREISDQHLGEKGEIYQDAIDGARTAHPYDIWSNSSQAFRNEFLIIEQEDNEACYILGLPYALRTNRILDPRELTEQGKPQYAVLVGSERGRYVCIRFADYPTSPPDRIGSHTIPCIIVERSSEGWFEPHFFGFYLEKEAFEADYKDSQIKPHLEERDIDGNFFFLPLN